MSDDTTLRILLAEDNPMDILMTKESLKDWKIKSSLHVVEDGEEALDFLYGRGNYIGAARPDLVLLDLNLPKRNGQEVLSAIKQDPELSHIIVVVVTTSDSEADLQMCRDLGARLCVTKPCGLEEYVDAINSIQDLWRDGHDARGDSK
jgi:CheY-like chemotaxis protein